MALEKKPNETPTLTGLGWTAIGIGALLVANSIYKQLNKYNLNGKVVLITGGSRGLGLVLARTLTVRGARLAICARSAQQLQSAKLDLERLSANKVLTFQTDLTSREQVREMIEQVVSYYGRIDILINNAGIVQVGPAESMTIEDYEDAMKTNFFAALYTIQAVLPHFYKRGSGRIVNITSVGGKIPVPHLLPYTASKFAFTGFSEGLHAEMKSKNIHVTTVIPHLMRTGSPRNITVKGNHEEEYAWFKIADSSPLLSQDVEKAAVRIVTAIENNEAEVYVGLTAKLAALAYGIAPSLVTAFLTLAERLLPDNAPNGMIAKKGFESESELSLSRVASRTDFEAIRNNEI